MLSSAGHRTSVLSAESDASVASTVKGDELTLNTSDDPTKRFEVRCYSSSNIT